jgi:hypothetical protein
MRFGMCWAYAAAGILFVSRSAASCCAMRLRSSAGPLAACAEADE